MMVFAPLAGRNMPADGLRKSFFVIIFSQLSFDMQAKTDSVSYRKLVVLFKKKYLETIGIVVSS